MSYSADAGEVSARYRPPGWLPAQLAADAGSLPGRSPNTLAAVKTYRGKNLACTGGVDGIAGHHTMSCLVAGSG